VDRWRRVKAPTAAAGTRTGRFMRAVSDSDALQGVGAKAC
jgi:hypothetical protein